MDGPLASLQCPFGKVGLTPTNLYAPKSGLAEGRNAKRMNVS